MDSKRQLQVGEVIKRNFSSVLQSIGTYIYGNILVSVTTVKMSPDLSQAKIYLSIYGTEDKNEVIDLMELNNTQLKQELVGRIRKHLRRMPQINFYVDDTIDEIYRVDELFSKIKTGEEE
jgi:ribosome-binding factor A